LSFFGFFCSAIALGKSNSKSAGGKSRGRERDRKKEGKQERKEGEMKEGKRKKKEKMNGIRKSGRAGWVCCEITVI
jgi:hypothetical protein